jgi:DNA-binding transcriptional ArsR family regulator
MASPAADLIFHPVRIRILVALARRDPMTAQQLAVVLGDVPPATLYRHLNKLAEGGVLRVAGERQVRGAVEKTYELTAEHVSPAPEELARAGRDAWMRYFTTFVASLLGEFGRYLRRERVDPAADGVSVHHTVLYLSDEELARLGAILNEAFGPYLAQGPAPGRSRRMFSTIVMPAEEVPEERPADQPGGRP